MKWTCSVCGYTYEGPEPPAKCPQCGVPADKFVEVKEGEIEFVDEHVVGQVQSIAEDRRHSYYHVSVQAAALRKYSGKCCRCVWNKDQCVLSPNRVHHKTCRGTGRRSKHLRLQAAKSCGSFVSVSGRGGVAA